MHVYTSSKLGTVIEDDMFTAGAQHASFFAGALAEKPMTNQSGLLNQLSLRDSIISGVIWDVYVANLDNVREGVKIDWLSQSSDLTSQNSRVWLWP